MLKPFCNQNALKYRSAYEFSKFSQGDTQNPWLGTRTFIVSQSKTAEAQLGRHQSLFLQSKCCKMICIQIVKKITEG